MQRPAIELMPNEVTEFGTVSHVVSTRRNSVVKVYFTDNTHKFFTRRERIAVRSNECGKVDSTRTED